MSTISDVQIIDLTFQPQPMPRYTCVVRAKIQPPFTSCVVNQATARVRKTGSSTNLDMKNLTRESSSSDWWRSPMMSLMGLSSGDTITALVDANWTCVQDEKDVPSVPVPIP